MAAWPASHLTINGTQIVFSIHHFMNHLYRAWKMYARHLMVDTPYNTDAITRFMTRFDRVKGVGAFMA